MHYLLRRLLLLPITLFAIILIHFVILNLMPGDPVTVTDRSQTGEAMRGATTSASEEHLLFREHYGLTLPVLINLWWCISREEVEQRLPILVHPQNHSVHTIHQLRTRLGDQARFILPHLIAIAQDPTQELLMRTLALNFAIRGATQQGFVGPTLNAEQKAWNRQVGAQNQQLVLWRTAATDTETEITEKARALGIWVEKHPRPPLSTFQLLFLETRFARYFSRVIHLDFGTLRHDQNKTVIHEVAKRLKYSMTLAVIPMGLTFILCLLCGMWMATSHRRLPDILLSFLFLILFAIPIFVVAPFLIEKVALHHTLPFTDIPLPLGGFHRSEAAYAQLTSLQRLGDTALHLLLPLVAIMYGTCAVQARLARTAFLEILKQDYIRTAYAKGLHKSTILFTHVGRNGAITMVTSLASSLGLILGGSLIVETVFEINGFGRFFYEAILNRDYNVILFSAFASSALTLIGYILADIAYMVLDPRIALSKD